MAPCGRQLDADVVDAQPSVKVVGRVGWSAWIEYREARAYAFVVP